jgi:hypothetical protein
MALVGVVSLKLASVRITVVMVTPVALIQDSKANRWRECKCWLASRYCCIVQTLDPVLWGCFKGGYLELEELSLVFKLMFD